MPATPDDEMWRRLGAAVQGALDGNAESWDFIVTTLQRRLMGAALAWGADSATAADAVQQTWLVACTHLHELRDARALGGWLRTTLRRILLNEARRSYRETPYAEFAFDGCRPSGVGEPQNPESVVLRAEEHRMVRRARARLAERDQQLLGLLAADHGPDYAEISRRMGMPVGSIGPTRARCLTRLRREMERLGMCMA